MDLETNTDSIRADMEDVQKRIDGYSSPESGSTDKYPLQQDGDLEDAIARLLSRPVSKRILKLFEAPEFTKRLRAYDEVDPGETVTFSAQYHAIPTPTVKWFKDEEEVRQTDRHQLDAGSETDGVVRLVVRDVVPTDEGAYKCKVENCEGTASTTGYLSVADKRSKRSKSTRTSGGKLNLPAKDRAVAGVSTPPFLGPIAEQKSMEEREEIELARQPPSPLQDFIDSIRRSSKSKHAPIFYGTGDIFAMNEDTSSEDDVFSNDESTPIRTPEYVTESESDTEPAECTRQNAAPIRVCAVDSFESPNINCYVNVAPPPPHAATAHKEDSAYNSEDSNVEEGQSTDDDENSVADSKDTPAAAESDALPAAGSFQRRRLGHLQLKHRLAIDIPDYAPVPSSPESSSSDAPSSSSAPTSTDTPASDSSASGPLPPPHTLTATAACPRGPDTSEVVERSRGGGESSRPCTVCASSSSLTTASVLDGLECRDVQFFFTFAASSTAVSAAWNVPPLWLIAFVAVVSVLWFCFRDWRAHRPKLRRRK